MVFRQLICDGKRPVAPAERPYRFIALPLMLCLLHFSFSTALAAPAAVPKTGQSVSFAAGDDGALLLGTAWPNSRFTDGGNGTITDNMTGLVWLKNVGCYGTKNWPDGLAAINNLAHGACDLTDNSAAGDWRLPNVLELRSLRDLSNNKWIMNHGFSNVPNLEHYWTSSGMVPDATNNAWVVSVFDSNVQSAAKAGLYGIWAVRSGSVTPVAQIPVTGQITSISPRDDGALKMGIAWPSPRFSDNADGTVSDNLTGLVWLKNANCFSTKTWYDSLTSANGLASGTCGLTDGSRAGEWHLPNANELESLVDISRSSPPISSGHPFTTVQSEYWSSSTHVLSSGNGWALSNGNGYLVQVDKNTAKYVWPVRKGRYWQFGSLAINTATSPDLGRVTNGVSTTPTVYTIRNTGTQAVTITSIAMTGTDSGNFVLVPGGATPCASLSPTLNANAYCTVSVSVPTVIGNSSAALTFTIDPQTYQIPLSATVARGVYGVVTDQNGLPVFGATVSLLGVTVLTGSDGSYLFDTPAVGTANITVTKYGYQPVTITGISILSDASTLRNISITSNPASVAATGQNICFDTTGNAIPCSGSGHDGEYQSGISWPAPRFTNPDDSLSLNGSIIRDRLTGLEWLRDANTITIPGGQCIGGTKNWQGALDYATCLNNNNYLGHNDWRLPNVTELESLINRKYSNQATWLSAGGFRNPVAARYWSSSTYAAGAASAWVIDMSDGNITPVGKGTAYYTWTVRDGQGTALLALPGTGQTSCYDQSGVVISCAGTKLDGDLQKGAVWPAVRFSDNGDQTVTDTMTGLIWTRDGNPTGPSACGISGAKSWQSALDYVRCLNSNNYLGYNDWRLPNTRELWSMTNKGETSNSTWLNSGSFSNAAFRNVSADWYWASDTYLGNLALAWVINMADGNHTANWKYVGYRVWPVRNNQSRNSGSLRIVLPQLPSAPLGKQYASSVLTTGGTPPYTFSIKPDSTLPDGLTLGSQSGMISGVPTTSGTSTFTVVVIDGVGGQIERQYSMLLFTGALPKTGQSVSFAGGDDAAQLVGTSWPNPRFMDNGNGTITDSLTGLIWLKKVDCISGGKNWYDGLAAVNTISNGMCNLSDGSGVGDWRLPNVLELRSLRDLSSNLWITNHGFSNVPALEYYWTSSSLVPDAINNAWSVSLYDSAVTGAAKSEVRGIWAVRTGSVTPVSPLPATGQVASISPRDDGALQHGVAWPSPRFSDNGDGTVGDNLTGLVWLKNANCFSTKTWYDSLSSANTLASGACGLTDGSRTGEWRLPNANELQSLVDISRSSPPLPSGHPFGNVMSEYWSSSTHVRNSVNGWALTGANGYLTQVDKNTAKYAWPVRQGRNWQSGSLAVNSATSPALGTITSGISTTPTIFTIRNSGTQPLTVTSIAVTGGGFAVSTGGPNPCGSLSPVLGARASCTVSIATPTVIGSNSGLLTVTSGGQTVEVQLSATVKRGVYGTVTDQSGSPVAGAVVSLLGATVRTGSDGRYLFDTPATGIADISATKYGYQPVTVTGVSILSGSSTVANISMTTYPSSIAATGQTACYDTNGNAIPCSGSGHDGEYQSGISWPNPRFTNPNGTLPLTESIIRDRLTGLEWMQDANTPSITGTGTCPGGAKTWQAAMDYVTCLNNSAYLGHNDWRMPNITELESMINRQYSNQTTWLSAGGFRNPVAARYWSSSTFIGSTASAWVMDFADGNFTYVGKGTGYYAWPVRDGQGGALLSLPQTGQTNCYDQAGTVIPCAGTGIDGDLKKGTAWPAVRFVDNGDQTITDTMSGLSWTKDGNPVGAAACGTAGTKNWQDTLDYIKCMNNNNYLGYTDWRLPNAHEMLSLANKGVANIATWLNSGSFTNVSSDWYRISDTYIGSLAAAWDINLTDGNFTADAKTTVHRFWPVRNNQRWKTGNLELFASSSNMGFVPVGNKSNTSVLLRNSGSEPLTVSSITMSGDTGQFNLLPGGGLSCGTLSPTLAAGSACSVSVIAAPTSAGGKSAVILIMSGGQSIDLPFSVTGYSSISGSITDISTGLAVAGATITLNNGASVVSGSGGSFVFGSLAAGTYSVTITKNGYQSVSQGNLVVTDTAFTSINILTAPPGTLSIITQQLPSAPLGRQYTIPILTTGGTLPYIFSIKSDSTLPPGIALNSQSGVLSGVPTALGSYTFTVVAAESASTQTEKQYSMVVFAATLPKTGQTVSFAANDDGVKLAGTAWPEPRLTDNGNGTITDNLTGLVWLKNVGCFGTKNWYDGLAAVNTLANEVCGLADGSAPGSWRLPNVLELRSLRDLNSNQWVINRGFSNVPNLEYYWTSSSTVPAATTNAWAVSLFDSNVTAGDKGALNGIWAVRSGTVTPAVPLPATGQTASISARDDGALKMGITWPSPRFSDNADGTVSDNLTGLVWLKNANCFGTKTWFDSLSSANTLANGACGLTDGSRAGEWHLPNANELESLVDISRSSPPLPSGHPFSNVMSEYWSSSTHIRNFGNGWALSNGNGYLAQVDKNTAKYAWPVRQGRYWQFGTLAINTATSPNLGTIINGVLTSPTLFTLRNTGTQTVAVASISAVGATNGQYTVAPGGATPCDSLAPVLNPGKSCTISIGIPTVIGSNSATLTFISGGQTFEIPLSANVTRGVYGKVSDQNGLPVFGAKLSLNGATARTGNDGSYLFDAPTPGVTEISVSKYGYQPVTVTGVSILSDASTLRNISITSYPTAVAATGQYTCFDASGNAVTCGGSGHDGEYQSGVSWPNPRFTNSDDTLPLSGSTIKDRLTGLEWLRDANTPTVTGQCIGGGKNWQGALDYVICLNNINYLDHNDWRLPNINEMESLANYQFTNQATWLTASGFRGVNWSKFWTSTTYVRSPSVAWQFIMFDGDHPNHPVNFSAAGKTDTCGSWGNQYHSYGCGATYTWPVRDSQGSSSLTLPRTGQTSCYDTTGAVMPCSGTGQDGELKKGAAWPTVRFVNNADQTVTDAMSGLIWSRDANPAGPAACGTTGAKTWQAALDYVKCLNSYNYLGYNDWRMPNARELMSLTNRGESYNATWLNNGSVANAAFTNVYAGWYWTSDTFMNNSPYSWMLNMDDGNSGGIDAKTNSQRVWLVRDNQRWKSGNLEVSAPSSNIGLVPVGYSSNTTLALRNSGTVPVSITGMTITGADAAQFSLLHGGGISCGSLTPTLAAGASCSVSVTVSPTTIGAKSTVITVASAEQSLNIPVSAIGYISIYGTVTDPASGAPLSGATITLNSGAVVQSYADGSYYFKNSLSPGTYSVTVSKTGYRSATYSGITVGASSSSRLDILLSTNTPLNFISTQLPSATAGELYSNRVLASGGVPPYSFTLFIGSLPPGLTLNAGTGVISGTPTGGGSYPFSIAIEDGVDTAVFRAFTIETVPSLSITTADLPRGKVGSGFPAIISARGGKPGYSFTKTAGALPTGLNLDPDGTFYGVASTKGDYTFTVTVSDSTGRVVSKQYQVGVDDPLLITTNRLNSGKIGTPYSQVLANSGGYSPKSWSLHSGSLPAGLTFDPASGTISGTPTEALTRYLTFKVGDGYGRTTYTTLPLTVAYPLAFSTLKLPNAHNSDPYSEKLRVAGGVPPYSFSMIGALPTGFALNTSTGVISGTSVQTGSTTANFTVTDSSWPTALTANLDNTQISVSDWITATTSAILPNARKGVPITPLQLVAKGSSSTQFIWTTTGGALPNGLSLNGSSGIISGTPTTPGDYSVMIRVTDSLNNATGTGDTAADNPDKTFFIRVSETLAVSTANLPVGSAGSQYAFVLESTGGLSPITWSIVSGTLPTGLTLAPATGIISGVPTASAVANFTVKATDSDGQTSQKLLSLTVSSVLSIYETALPTARIGQKYTANIRAQAGMKPYTWQVTSGALPDGITLQQTADGVTLNGNPTKVGDYTFTLELSDSSAQRQIVSRQFNVRSAAAISIDTQTLAVVPSGNTYSQQIDVTGGVAPYTYSISSGTLLQGLSLNSASGLINGIKASTAGLSAIFTARVTDSGNPSASVEKQFSITATGGFSVAGIALTGALTGSVICTGPDSNGGSATCTITPASGNVLKTLTDNNIHVINSIVNNSYTIPSVTADHNVVATFGLSSPVSLTLQKSDPAGGSVTSIPGGIVCDTNCTSATTSFNEGTSVTFTVQQAKGYNFLSWNNCTRINDTQCTVTVAQGLPAVMATFSAMKPTTLSINPKAANLVLNQAITIAGQLAIIPAASSQELNNQPISITVQQPNGTVSTYSSTTKDNDGHWDITLTNFYVKGTYLIRASYSGSRNLINSQSELAAVLVEKTAGYAIVVHGKVPSNEGLADHRLTTDTVIKQLKSRSLLDDNIIHLTSSENSAVTKAQVQNAIQNWARTKMNALPSPLYIIMVDHGSYDSSDQDPNNRGRFHIGSESITPTDLDGWITNLENNLTSQALLEKRIIIIGSCYSGSFIKKVGKQGRVVIASATQDEESIRGQKIPGSSVRSGEYFLDEFFNSTARGKTIKESFEDAREQVKVKDTRRIGYGFRAGVFDNMAQHPLIDDNGDGIGSYKLDNSYDGQQMASFRLGEGAILTNAVDNPGDIKSKTPTSFLSSAQTSANIWLTANFNGRVDAVWAEIRKPGLVTTIGSGSGGQVILDLEIVNLSFNAETGRWEGSYGSFNDSGMYEIFYYTHDSVSLDISPMTRSIVYKGLANNTAPAAFNLLSPANNSQEKTQPVLMWQPATDSQSVTYTLMVSTSSDFSSGNIPPVENITGTSYAVPANMLNDLTTYWWKVRAIDSYGATTDSPAWSFKTDNSNALGMLIYGVVRDAVTLQLINGVQVSVNTTPTQVSVADYSGEYFLRPQTLGSYNLTLTHPEYQSVTMPVNMTSLNLEQNAYLTIKPAANGACGSSNNAVFTSAPATGLCSVGSTTSFSATGSGWTWSCQGTQTTDNCSASMQTYALTFQSGGNGTLDGTTSQTVKHGANAASVMALPATGYHFVSWTGTGGFVTTTSNPLDVNNVTSAQTFTANFAIDPFAVSFISGGNGTVSGSASQTVNYGGSASSVTAVPAIGFHFVNWTVGGGIISTDNTLTVTNVTTAKTITANFAIDTFALNFVSGVNGTLSGSAGQTVNYNGTSASVTAVPATGYHFVNWTGSGGFMTSTSNPLTITNVTSAQTVTANFAINNFAVNFNSAGYGTITGTTSQTVNYGESATTVTAVPTANYHFVNWTGTPGFITSVLNPLTLINVTVPQTITANFAIDTFTVSFTATNGTLSSTSQTINYGGNTTAVTAVPATGYHFVNWTGTGGFSTSTSNPIVVTNVTANQIRRRRVTSRYRSWSVAR